MLLRRCIAPSLSLTGLQTTPPMLPHKQCQAENLATSSNCESFLCVDGRPTCDIARCEILRRWQPPYVHTSSSGDTSKLKCLIIPAVSHPILIAAPFQCYIQPITVEAPMKVSIDRPAIPDPVAVRQGSISSTEALSTAHLASMTDPFRGKAPKGSVIHKPTPTQLSFILLKLREEVKRHNYDHCRPTPLPFPYRFLWSLTPHRKVLYMKLKFARLLLVEMCFCMVHVSSSFFCLIQNFQFLAEKIHVGFTVYTVERPITEPPNSGITSYSGRYLGTDFFCRSYSTLTPPE